MVLGVAGSRSGGFYGWLFLRVLALGVTGSRGGWLLGWLVLGVAGPMGSWF